MISATTCKYQGEEISVDEALSNRDNNSSVPREIFTCIECNQRLEHIKLVKVVITLHILNI